jgi:hypothetical protein
MIPFLIASRIGMKGALILGFTVAEILTHYWNSKENPPKIYIFGRRVHHGEIGALLSLSLSLLLGKLPISVAGILAGLGGGLVKDDFADINQWFRFKMKTSNKKLLEEQISVIATRLNMAKRLNLRPNNVFLFLSNKSK